MVLVGRRYRLDLTPAQEELARATAGCCRLIWNLGLEQRQLAYRLTGRSPGYAAQCAELPGLKREFPFLSEVPSHCLQQALRDLDSAFARFFGGEARHPRFKKKDRSRDSFRFPDPAQISVRRLNRRFGAVQLPKLGWCRFRWSRALSGEVANATVSRDGGDWYVSFCVELADAPVVANGGPAVGVDRGVAIAVATSEGGLFDRATWTAGERRRLVRLEREKARRRKGSANWRKTVAAIARLHARARSRRVDFAHQVSTRLAKSHGLVVLEALAVKAMSASARGTEDAPGRNAPAKAALNRGILDKAWGELARQLAYKCPREGSLLVVVPARHTSQECARCGHTDPGNRPARDRFCCLGCGHRAHADVNAAAVIRGRGIELASAGGLPVAARGAGPSGPAVKREPDRASAA